MITLDGLTEFLGWCSAINIAVLLFATFFLIFLRNVILPLHARIFDTSEDTLFRLYLQYLSLYKIALFIFNLVPYVALKLMA